MLQKNILLAVSLFFGFNMTTVRADPFGFGNNGLPFIQNGYNGFNYAGGVNVGSAYNDWGAGERSSRSRDYAQLNCGNR